ncbi:MULTISPECIES: hypothetical protein [Bradyrhizobium]|uniref:Uncharacterized protein n=1 Tax=Bradyrhizobium elkanii TaxID=29448 RepID=A0A4U6RE35_BRAEL|nr:MULTISPECIES: hypothetical protein [Bradyrhizobium]MTV13165.1 hypothetical protein [Bradyrhizobium sp. BR2003]TKV70926.1 hypothetical protein FDV58_40790 [Bradyrhizobium elkanii]
MSAFFVGQEHVIGLLLIAAGFLMVLVGLIASRRHRRFEESQEEENLPDPSRPRMAPLPNLLSTERPEQRD